jgi:hypothetical protein
MPANQQELHPMQLRQRRKLRNSPLTQGLNVILAQYYKIINNKYTTLKGFYNGSSLTNTQKAAILSRDGLK